LTSELPVVDYISMRKVGEILGKKYGNLTKVMRIRDRWSEIAGDVLAAHTEPVQLKGKILYVLCDSPAWVQQVDILGPTIQPRIKKMAGFSIDKISATFGMSFKSRDKKRKKQIIPIPDIDPADVDRIRNPELKRTIQELLDIQGENDG
jgi:predicted nucleic acid-binding Zn ribbon protein